MEKQVDNTQEQRIEIAEKYCGSSYAMDKRYKQLYGHRDNIYKAMQEYADLRCKPLIEALEEVARWRPSVKNPQIRIKAINQIGEKALQDYKK